MLSGPKALEDLRFLVADLSSDIEKGEVSIGRVLDIGTLGRIILYVTFRRQVVFSDFFI